MILHRGLKYHLFFMPYDKITIIHIHLLLQGQCYE